MHEYLQDDGKINGVCFIGISNYILDAAKINRALFLSVPNLEENIDELIDTSKGITKNIFNELAEKNIIVFNLLSGTYHEYKKFVIYLKKMKALKKFLEENKEYNNERKELHEIEGLEFIQFQMPMKI